MVRAERTGARTGRTGAEGSGVEQGRPVPLIQAAMRGGAHAAGGVAPPPAYEDDEKMP